MKSASWASKCPVTRSDHEWVTTEAVGQEREAYCEMCTAKWIGVDAEWDLAVNRHCDTFVHDKLSYEEYWRQTEAQRPRGIR